MTVAESTFDEVFALEPRAVRCPFGAYQQTRAENPVFWSDRVQAFVVSRYEDIAEVLRAPEKYSSSVASGPRSVTPLAAQLLENPDTPAKLRAQAERRMQISKATVLLFSDPPNHVRQRKLVNKGFTARRINGMEEEIRGVARGLVDRFAADGRVELVSQFSIGLPMTVIADLVGVPQDMHDTFKRWSDNFTAGTGNFGLTSDEVADMFDSVDQFYDFFTEQVEARRAEPRDDLLSDLVAARIGGEEPLQVNEILQMLVQFLVAGNETTTNLVTSIVYRLVTDAALMAKVREDLSLVQPLVEEVLRVESPVQGMFRRATEDSVIGGVEIPEGSILWLSYGSANRDESQFRDSEQITLGRSDPQPHLAFGRGEHFCLGAGLARLEARVGVQTLLERLDDIALDGSDEDLAYLPNFMLRGIRKLPLTFTAR
ncbi:cytochrome P450 [Pseudonocardia acidicola]|uniref:Cytochrome P450 n=1 Tax=Pseudonocardia acidicola TaxID=2724939 RepID=A0ABX1SBH0_9PSEU|nr:cytochrome P450 [Pseudonocardia acidicola]NMH98249.1 cytochrome P450 [Pseudonocardia acidicola]